jgi:hypothetical protein
MSPPIIEHPQQELEHVIQHFRLQQQCRIGQKWKKAQEALQHGTTRHSPSQNPDKAFSNNARSCSPIPCIICALSNAPPDAASCCSVCSCRAVRGVRCVDRAVQGALGASDFPPNNAAFPLSAAV